jgi:PKD repeat protein
VNGDYHNDPDYQHGGVHLFRPDAETRFVRVADSENGAGSFNYAWDPETYGEEPEGIDYWDRNTGPVSPGITGQLHVILLNTDMLETDELYIKHYTLNTPPVADAGADQTVDEGDLVTLDGSFIDPDTGDTHTVLWHLEESTNGQAVPDSTEDTLTFTPNDNGVYTFSFTVTDSQGATGSDTVVITANNVPPVVSAPAIALQPNSEFILPVVHEIGIDGTFSDAGTADTHTAVWDWGDSSTSPGTVDESAGSGTVTDSHTYALPGDYTVTLTVTDDDGGTDASTMTVHVADTEEALDIFNDYIQGLDSSMFKEKAGQRKNAFDNMFSAIDDMLADEEYQGMIKAMNSNIRTKFDGLVDGSPKDDWIIQDLTVQAHLCQKVDDITEYLGYLLSATG